MLDRIIIMWSINSQGLGLYGGYPASRISSLSLPSLSKWRAHWFSLCLHWRFWTGWGMWILNLYFPFPGSILLPTVLVNILSGTVSDCHWGTYAHAVRASRRLHSQKQTSPWASQQILVPWWERGPFPSSSIFIRFVCFTEPQVMRKELIQVLFLC